jgi:tripartite-type tricarboxylate transporter receptor subunit TctC
MIQMPTCPRKSAEFNGEGEPSSSARRRIVLAAGLGAVASRATAQSAAGFPSQPIRIVVPSAPGGTTDLYSRLFSKALTELLGQPVVIENKPGAGAVIGTETVVKARPDGHTMLIGSLPLSTNPGLMARLPYDALTDLRPVVQISAQGFIVSVGHKSPYQSFAEVIAAARQRDMPYATPGIGTVGHLSGQVLNVEYGTRFVHVGYRGSAPAIQDVVAGQLDVLIDPVASGSAAISAGHLRPVAVTNATRFPMLPNTPTLRELGFPLAEALAYSGMLVPAATPTDIVNKLNAAFNDAMKRPDVRQGFERLNVRPVGGSPEVFGALIRSETERWVPLIRRLGLKAD